MSNNNVTVAIPGNDNWAVWWTWQSGFENFQLDIVGFLAVLGEDSVKANAQVAALSWLFLLPRLLPAPQALIPTQRLLTLSTTTATVTGVYSGNGKEHLHHIAGLLCCEPEKKYTVKCITITKDVNAIEKRGTGWIDTFLRGEPKRFPANTENKSSANPEKKSFANPEQKSPANPENKVKYRPKLRKRLQKFGLRKGPRSEEENTGDEPPFVRGKAAGPMFWVTMVGFAEVVVLLTCSIVFGDGMSILATILLGGLSSVAGISNKWTLELTRRSPADAPKGDVVIRYPKGSFLVVKCEEDVARELFFAPEEINYKIKSPTLYMTLSLIGTIMLMLGIIALANAKLQLQLAWAGAFIIINISHWFAAALPQEKHWDLDGYKVKYEKMIGNIMPENPNFTQALWKAIYFSGSTAWVKKNKAAPSTPVWNEWLNEAKGHLFALSPHSQAPHPQEWDAKEAWNRINTAHEDDEELVSN